MVNSCRSCHDFLIGTGSLNTTIRQFNYLRAVFQSGETVSDDENGDILTEPFNGLHNGLLGFIVQRTGGFVEDNDIGLLAYGAGEADALALRAIIFCLPMLCAQLPQYHPAVIRQAGGSAESS